MTDPDLAGETPEAPEPGPESTIPSVAARLALYQRAGGFVVPLITTVFAFLIGGLVVLVVTHKNPVSTYKAIFNGTGLNWFFPWISHSDRVTAAFNLQSTLLLTTALILTPSFPWTGRIRGRSIGREAHSSIPRGPTRGRWRWPSSLPGSSPRRDG